MLTILDMSSVFKNKYDAAISLAKKLKDLQHENLLNLIDVTLDNS